MVSIPKLGGQSFGHRGWKDCVGSPSSNSTRLFKAEDAFETASKRADQMRPVLTQILVVFLGSNIIRVGAGMMLHPL